jgi:hypothetical protein
LFGQLFLYATISKLVIILVSRVRTKKLLVKTPLVSFLLETCFVELNIKFFVNDNVYDVGYIRSDGMIFGVNRNSFNDTDDNTDKLRKQLSKARKKAKRWKQKYLELRYDLDKAKTDNY